MIMFSSTKKKTNGHSSVAFSFIHVCPHRSFDSLIDITPDRQQTVTTGGRTINSMKCANEQHRGKERAFALEMESITRLREGIVHASCGNKRRKGKNECSR